MGECIQWKCFLFHALFCNVCVDLWFLGYDSKNVKFPPVVPPRSSPKEVTVYFSYPMLHTPTHPFNGPFSGTTQVSWYQKVKPIWILLKQEKVSGSGISWAIWKSAPCSRQIITPAPHHSVFYRPDALPVAQPTASKHWRQKSYPMLICIYTLYTCIHVCMCGLTLYSLHSWHVNCEMHFISLSKWLKRSDWFSVNSWKFRYCSYCISVRK